MNINTFNLEKSFLMKMMSQIFILPVLVKMNKEDIKEKQKMERKTNKNKNDKAFDNYFSDYQS